MMRIGRRAIPRTVTLAALVLLTSCRGLPTGPTLANVVVGPLSLEPTVGDRALCCCRVVGKATNMNAVPVHATFKFTAFDADRVRPISKILYFIADFRPGAERSIDAHGFVYPCNIIRELTTEVDIRGFAFPPL